MADYVQFLSRTFPGFNPNAVAKYVEPPKVDKKKVEEKKVVVPAAVIKPVPKGTKSRESSKSCLNGDCQGPRFQFKGSYKLYCAKCFSTTKDKSHQRCGEYGCFNIVKTNAVPAVREDLLAFAKETNGLGEISGFCVCCAEAFLEEQVDLLAESKKWAEQEAASKETSKEPEPKIASWADESD